MGTRQGSVVILLVAVASAMLIGLAAPPAGADENRRVAEISFTGNRQYQQSSLTYWMKTKVGQLYSESKLAEDVSTLLTFFARVTTNVTDVPGGVRIDFIVEENPAVALVAFRGFSKNERKDLLERVETKRDFAYAEFMVQRDRTLLTDLLKKKGFYFAEVAVAVGDSPRGKEVLFTAIEGPEVEVEDLFFVGNASFDEDELEDNMIFSESGFLSSTPFVERTLEQDLIGLAGFYRSEGFLDAVVELRDLSFSPERDEVSITIGIEEGQAYLVDSVEVRGGASFPADRSAISALIGIETGDRRREEDVFKTSRAIRSYYLENAYYNAEVEVEIEDDSVSHRSRIVYTIREGSPVRIRRLEIVGNTLTRDDVIRRELTVHAGGPLNTLEIRKSLSRLENLSYFDREELNYEVVETGNPGERDVVFKVGEGRTGAIRFSAGITSDFGLLGLVELEKRNFDYADLPDSFGQVLNGRAFTGGGQSLNALLAPGADYSQYRLSFTEPWFLPNYLLTGPGGEVEESPYSFGISGYRTIFTHFAYDEGRTGFTLSTGKSWRTVGKRLDDVVRARMSGTFEGVRIDNLDDDAATNAFGAEGWTQVRKLALSLNWQHVDFAASPGEGFDASLTYTLSGGFLGGELDAHRFEFGTTHYFTLYTNSSDQRHILSVTGRIGLAQGFGGTDDIPIFDRFFAGGTGTVRGFSYGEVGPRSSGNPATPEGQALIAQSLADGDGDPTGGEAMWLARVEYGIPLYEDYLRAVIFSDAGSVTNSWGKGLLRDSRVSLGFGFRIRIPFLGPTPLALDFAWPLRDEKGDDLQVFSFTFDRPF